MQMPREAPAKEQRQQRESEAQHSRSPPAQQVAQYAHEWAEQRAAQQWHCHHEAFLRRRQF